MNIEQIKKIISDCEALNDLVKSKVAVLEKLDRDEYSTAKGIETIEFENDHVYVQCDASSWGSQDYTSFEFPIIWLTQPDEEMERTCVIEKELRRIKQVEFDEKVRLKKEQTDLREYNRLKAKFEPK